MLLVWLRRHVLLSINVCKGCYEEEKIVKDMMRERVLTKSENWREVGELGVADALRNGQTGNGDARYEV